MALKPRVVSTDVYHESRFLSSNRPSTNAINNAKTSTYFFIVRTSRKVHVLLSTVYVINKDL